MLEYLLFLLLTVGTLGFVAVFLRAMYQNPNGLLPLMLIGLGIGFLWLLYVSIHSAWR